MFIHTLKFDDTSDTLFALSSFSGCPSIKLIENFATFVNQFIPDENEDRILLYNADFIGEIKRIVTQARQKAYTAINSAMVEAYWQMGKRIVEQEQQGKDRADYGSQLLKSLSKELTAEFGKGFSVNSLYYFDSSISPFPKNSPQRGEF